VRYVAVDVGRDGLTRAATELTEAYPAVHVHAVVGDFERHLGHLPAAIDRRLVLFLGSTLGNFDPPARRTLLAEIRRLLGPDGRLLLGLDLVKDRHVLEAAYDDDAGVTRDFNRNVLYHVNRLVDGNFVPGRFLHHARYDADAERIEMHLLAASPQRVELGRLRLTLDFDEGDGIWTENSYKFTPAGTESMLADAGLALEAWHTDPERRFALVLCRSSR
jgi:L-histidine N-alpha-methyltransferase